MRNARLLHYSHCVSNLERSRRFYAEVLGFEVIAEFDFDDPATAKVMDLPGCRFTGVFSCGMWPRESRGRRAQQGRFDARGIDRPVWHHRPQHHVDDEAHAATDQRAEEKGETENGDGDAEFLPRPAHTPAIIFPRRERCQLRVSGDPLSTKLPQ